MNRIILITSFILVVAHFALAEGELEPYQKIMIEPVFSKLITRDNADRLYTGQIKSEAGLAEFEKTYGIDIDSSEVNFDKQMLIFGITDDITTRAFQFLKQEKIRVFTLDYAETRMKYRLRRHEDGKKYSYIQVFALKKIEDIPHIGVKNRVRIVFSKVYDKKDNNN